MLKSPLAPALVSSQLSSPLRQKGVGGVIELVTNGDFASASGWTAGVGWSVVGGQGRQDGTGGATDYIARPLLIPITAGKTIRWSITLGANAEDPATSISTLLFIADDVTGTNAEAVVDLAGQGVGTYSGTFTLSSSHATACVLFSYRTVSATIDNLSITIQG